MNQHWVSEPTNCSDFTVLSLYAKAIVIYFQNPLMIITDYCITGDVGNFTKDRQIKNCQIKLYCGGHNVIALVAEAPN